MSGLVATGTPLSHIVPVVPDSVIATCCQPVGSCGPEPLAGIICDPAPALMSNRSAFVPPALAVRNMKSDVPLPKSKIRDHVCPVDATLTQVAIVKSRSPLTMPSGRPTYSPVPDRWTALPVLPGPRGPVADVVVALLVRRGPAGGAGPVRPW